ncbi:hypothetical protein WH47_02370, partial [Habropoda laboriosa]
EDLNEERLLQRYVDEFNQNKNENLNNLIWKTAPKAYSGTLTVEIAAYVANCISNEGTSLLHSYKLCICISASKSSQICVYRGCGQYTGYPVTPRTPGNGGLLG